MNEKVESAAEPHGQASRLADILDPSFEAFVRASKLGADTELGENAKKAQRQRLLLERLEAKATLKEKIAVANMAEEVGVTALALTGLQMRGALLSIVDGARDASQLAEYAAAGQAWLDARRPRRGPGRFRVFVGAAVIGAEFAKACASLRMRRVPVPSGFSGRVPLAEALNLGKLYAATVQIEYGGAQPIIVNRGIVDAALVSQIEAELGTGADPAITAAADTEDGEASEHAGEINTDLERELLADGRSAAEEGVTAPAEAESAIGPTAPGAAMSPSMRRPPPRMPHYHR